MWTCSKCNREFQKNNQHHFCSQSPKTIDEYISSQSDSILPILYRVREIFKSCFPEATEKMVWMMPTFWQGKNLIHFIARKSYLGIYPSCAIEKLPFPERLANYKTAKGALQFPFDKQIDYDLITDIAKYIAGEI